MNPNTSQPATQRSTPALPSAPATAGNFIALLQGKTGGVTLLQLDQELAALVRLVQSTRRAGTLTYKVKITPNAKSGVRIEDDISVKEPKAEVGVSFFYADESGALLRNDPNQTEMKLIAVPDPDQLSANSPRVVNS